MRQEFVQQSKQTEYNKPFVDKDYLQKNKIVDLNLTGTTKELQSASSYVNPGNSIGANTMSNSFRTGN